MQPKAPAATMRRVNRFNASNPPETVAPTEATRRFTYTQPHMGVPVRCTLFSRDEASARAAAQRVFDGFARCDAVFSDWRDDTEAMRLCAGATGRWQAVSSDMHAVLRIALEVSEATDGLFDVTVGPLVRLWRISRRTGRLPFPGELRAARRSVGWRRVQVDPHRPSVRLEPGTQLDFGGIAKGYAAKTAVEAASAMAGIAAVLVEAGGDMAAGSPPPGQTHWRIALPDGSRRGLVGECLSTSGDDYQRVEIGGRRYAHIMDPRTGLGAENVRRTSVAGDSGALVDAVATASCLADEPLRARLAARLSLTILSQDQTR